MSNQRTHFVTTTDGVTIGGGVHGEGPPLVFVHGMMADGDLDWLLWLGLRRLGYHDEAEHMAELFA